MKIRDLLCLKGIDLNAKVISKDEAIDHLIDLMMANGNISDRDAYKQGIMEREAKSTTGVGEEIAIPHARVDAVVRPGLSVMIVKNGIDYDSLDGLPVKLFFMIAAPKDGVNVHLEALARLSGMLIDHEFKERLLNAKSPEEFLALIDAKESENKDDKNKIERSYDVLAVTACPTGIAHTFMAAESLETKAKEMNISFKVETNGAAGPKNVLTKEEIENAKCIIIAADKQVEMSRFNGKPLIITKAADGINKPEELLKQAINGKAVIFDYQDEAKKAVSQNKTILRTMYIQLSAGISKILPILMGSGVLISIAALAVSYNLFNITSLVDNVWIANCYVFGNAVQGLIVALLAGFIGQAIAMQTGFAAGFSCGVATQLNVLYLNDINNPGLLGGIIAGFIGGYMVLFIQRLCKNIPEQFNGVKSITIYPVFSIILGGLITYLISPYIGVFNHTISVFISEMNLVCKLILGMAAGGMMSVDMGGPINKIAYIFGISQILEGNFDVMAAVMAGGMVPPLAIAFATSFFENKFSSQEKEMGHDNFLKGLIFISEGTIPFVQKEPQLVTVACIIASIIAGGLSMVYNCEIRIPHGGIFVLPLISYPFRFLVALLAGTICGGAIYGLWKESGDE